MCLIAWNWQPDSDMPLLLLSNRDEFHARPAMPLHWWNNGPNEANILAGKDLQAGGTWLGLNRSGRLAALTNHRVPEPTRVNTPSRGELVAGFLQSDSGAEQYLQQLAHCAQDYNPFNLLVFDGHQLMGLESRSAEIITMHRGIGAVSNANFQTPWPKLSRLKERLQTQLDQHAIDPQSLLALLHDRTQAPDPALPNTGIPLSMERVLSATFIATPAYGTRTCSVISLHRDHAEFTEQRFDAQGLVACENLTFQLQPHNFQGNPLIRS